MARDSFVFYRSFAEACRELDAETFKEAVLAMCDYAMDGEEPRANGAAKAIFIMAKPVIDSNNQKYENGKKGGRPKNQTETEEKPNDNQTITKAEPNETEPEPYVDVDVNEYVNVNIKEKGTPLGVPKEKSTKRFSPPTLEEVKSYCAERNNRVDAEHFIDFYQRQDWYLSNGRKMKDWRAAVRNWEYRDKTKPKVNKFNNFEQRQTTDFDELERRMFNRRVGT